MKGEEVTRQMNAPTMAIQQQAAPKVQPKQSQYDVVRNGKATKGDTANKSRDFEKLLEKLADEGLTKEKGEQILSDMLEDETEQNAMVLAAELLAQNPLLAALLANAGVQTAQVSAEIATAQMPILQNNTQPIGGLNIAQTPEELLAQLANNGKTAIDLNVQENIPILADAKVVQANEQAQTQATQATSQTANDGNAKNVQVKEQIVLENIIKIKQEVSVEKQESPKNNAEGAFALEIAAQKAKIASGTNPQNTGTQGENQSGNQADKSEPTAVKVSPKAITDETEATAEKLEFVAPKMQDNLQQVRFEAKNMPLPNAKEVLNQVQTGIMQNAKAGNEEFVLHLRPEGLGEITVKMATENGRITMQLSVQNQNVQRILANEIDALRDAVKPFNVEVKEIANSNNSHFDNNAQQQSSFLQGQFQGQFTNQNSKNGFAYQTVNYGQSEDTQNFSEEDSTTQQTIKSSAIDTYI